MYWECYKCHQINQPCLQVDVVEGDKILLSNYYEQRYVTCDMNPPLNAPFCLTCLDDMPGLQNKFEKENTDTYCFEMNGYTCRSKEKEESFQRQCMCSGCHQKIISKSVFIEDSSFYILWSPHLISRGFPDASLTQAFKLINPSQFQTPSFLCQDCFNKEPSIPYPGPIVCPLCDHSFSRWIFHWAKRPVYDGARCYCHVNKNNGTIMDGYVSPEEFEWVGEKPDKFQDNKSFCYNCLEQMVTEGLLKSLWESEES